MSVNRDVAERYRVEVWNGKDLDAADEIFTADHVYHDPLMPDLPKGPEGVKARRSAYLTAMSDATVMADRWLEDGDFVVTMWTYAGTNDGEILGMPATGRRAEITGNHIFRLENGRIAETWTQSDTVGLLRQLGLFPG